MLCTTTLRVLGFANASLEQSGPVLLPEQILSGKIPLALSSHPGWNVAIVVSLHGQPQPRGGPSTADMQMLVDVDTEDTKRTLVTYCAWAVTWSSLLRLRIPPQIYRGKRIQTSSHGD